MGADMKCIILAGGRGTRFAEETHLRPKPMIEIEGKPILLHLMDYYSSYGVNDFVITLGYLGNVIKEWLVDLCQPQGSVLINTKSGSVSSLGDGKARDWSVLALETGLDTQTGNRIRQAIENFTDEIFFATYGDGLSDVNLNELVKFHKSHGKIATVTAVKPPARFGHLHLAGDVVTEFTEKSVAHESRINGGFFVFDRRILDFFLDKDEPLETGPLARVAQNGEMKAFIHDGFWQNMDTQRDQEKLKEIWNSGAAPWDRSLTH